MRTFARGALLFVFLALPVGCAGVPASYVAADEATLNAIGDDYERRVDADPTLTAEQKATRKDTVKSWRSRVATAKSGLGK